MTELTLEKPVPMTLYEEGQRSDTSLHEQLEQSKLRRNESPTHRTHKLWSRQGHETPRNPLTKSFNFRLESGRLRFKKSGGLGAHLIKDSDPKLLV